METGDMDSSNIESGVKNELLNPGNINSSIEGSNHQYKDKIQDFILHESFANKSCSNDEQLNVNRFDSVGDSEGVSNNIEILNHYDDTSKLHSTDSSHVQGNCSLDKNSFDNVADVDGLKKNENLKEEKHEEEKNSTEVQEDETKTDEWMDILGSGCLKKKLIKAGIPDTRPQKSDLCTISYTCELEDGTFIERVDSLTINMGDYEINQGIDFALALMDKDEESYILVTSRFGFGNTGCPPIPPKATLLYKLKILDVQKEDISSLNLTSRVQLGLKKKEKGNFWYQRGDHTCAIYCYRRALEYFDDTDIPGECNENELQSMLEERLKVYNNLAASQTIIGAIDAALISVNNVLTCQPKNIKALFRKSKILKEKGDIEECIKVIKQGLDIDPENTSLKKELANLLMIQRAQNNRQKELYKKMMGSRTSNVKKENRKKQANNTLKWITIASFTVAVLGALVIKYRY